MINRYQTEEMKELWNEQSKYSAWLAVEIAVCEAFHSLGVIPKDDLDKIKHQASFNVNRIEQIELETHHDIVAFTRAVSETLGNEKKWIHYGMTSTDIVDTAWGYLIKQANHLIDIELQNLKSVIKNKALEHKYTVQMGRTHGVHAELTTFGYKMALYYDELNRHLRRFKDARSDIEIGKISGAVGTYANVDPAIQDKVCEILNISSSTISTQTLQRDRHTYYIHVLSGIANLIDKMAVEFRHLQRTELREVEESFGKNQKGSSAMPHKKNPISSENMSGLARVLRGYYVSISENVALWHERDISHSSVERIIIPDATTIIHYMLRRFTKVIQNLKVNKHNMINNIRITNNVFFSQRLLLTLIEKKNYSREEAYDLVQPIALECFNKQIDFKATMKNKLENILEDELFERCFKTDYHLKQIDFVFNRLGLQ